jgi:hypothetical protein
MKGDRLITLTRLESSTLLWNLQGVKRLYLKILITFHPLSSSEDIKLLFTEHGVMNYTIK